MSFANLTLEELKATQATLAMENLKEGVRLYKPYPKQKEFHDAGGKFRELVFAAGNQVGKTYASAAELAIHLTGEYPSWWAGRRWSRPVHVWAAGVTGESTRDTLQRLLMGRPGRIGTGTIPADCIISSTAGRGVADTFDNVIVKYKSGGSSTLGFKSYAAGREKWQGETLDIVAFDEEPPQEIYTEGLTRTNATGGRVWLTFTPLMGMSEVVRRFFEEKSPDRGLIQGTIMDAEHYTQEERDRIVASYPAHEREARANGVPVLGSGRVFPVSEELITCEAFALPKHWPRIVGVDFGWQHPAAAVWVAWDRDTDTAYVYDTFRLSETSVALQAPLLAARGKWIPVCWPHDGLQHDKGSGEELANQYRNLGVNMLPQRAQFEGGGNGVEAGIADMLVRMQTGRLKVFSNQQDWFGEFRMYHRKNGIINKINDDLMAATRYAVAMSLRHASTEPGNSMVKASTINFGARRGGY